VEASELPFRMMCRAYKTQYCYTPMFHAKIFAEDPIYRQKNFSTCPEDRPLAVQFCANDPEILLRAAKLVEDQCDAVDINLGCPQRIARRGSYGAFILHDFPLLHRLVSILHQNLSVPVTCKIRLLPREEDTLKLVKVLESAGCQLLAVHGRTKEQKGANAGPTDYNMIRKIKETVSIPVIANGSIGSFHDIEYCLKETTADGVMTAYASLKNPAFFAGIDPDKCGQALEYLAYVEKYPVRLRPVRTHIHKLLRTHLEAYPDSRQILSESKTVSEIQTVVLSVQHRIKNNFVLSGNELQKWKMERIKKGGKKNW